MLTLTPILPDSATLETWVSTTEALANLATFVGVLGGVIVYLQWRGERKNRGTDVMLELENRFNTTSIRKGRALIEEDPLYAQIRKHLTQAATSGTWRRVPQADGGFRRPAKAVRSAMAALDDLLRFYVFLKGVRSAKQVPDIALRQCFRYWLAHYHHPERLAFKRYIDTLYPTLRNWLSDDAELQNSRLKWRQRRCFFLPGDFGWEKAVSERLAAALNGKLLIITGSGISTESGIPTFRGKGGYWRNMDPHKLATRRAFNDNPELVWQWYRERRDLIRNARPNEAHKAVACMGRSARRCLVVTQNVDDLHERGGLSSEHIVHIHGDIFVDRCVECDYRVTSKGSGSGSPPVCPHCKKGIRPGVVWFDEELDKTLVERIDLYVRQGPCDAVLLIGTTASFDYIRDWARAAAGHRGTIIEVNPDHSEASDDADIAYRCRATEILPVLARRAEEYSKRIGALV